MRQVAGLLDAVTIAIVDVPNQSFLSCFESEVFGAPFDVWESSLRQREDTADLTTSLSASRTGMGSRV